MRMDDRLQNADFPPDNKHPIILPSRHLLTDMIIRKYCQQEGHCGTSHALNAIWSKYWIVGGLAAVRKVLLSCMNCRFWNAESESQRMGNLPECRAAAGQPLFAATGADLMGPTNVQQGRSLAKSYVVF